MQQVGQEVVTMAGIWWVLVVLVVLGGAAAVWAAIYYGELKKRGPKQ